MRSLLDAQAALRYAMARAAAHDARNVLNGLGTGIGLAQALLRRGHVEEAQQALDRAIAQSQLVGRELEQHVQDFTPVRAEAPVALDAGQLAAALQDTLRIHGFDGVQVESVPGSTVVTVPPVLLTTLLLELLATETGDAITLAVDGAHTAEALLLTLRRTRCAPDVAATRRRAFAQRLAHDVLKRHGGKAAASADGLQLELTVPSWRLA